MSNPYVNKVVLGSEVLLDLTSDTVSPGNLVLGETAHNSAGEKIVGTFKEIVKLWENSSPTSNFAAQTINIDLSEYTGIIVVFRFSTDITTGVSSIVAPKRDSDGSYFCEIMGGLNISGAPYLQRRGFDFSDNAITFESAFRKQTTSTSASSANNGFVIPLYIYGLK